VAINKETKKMTNTVVYGRGPNGRALRKDGTERKERKTLTPAERMLQLEEQTKRARSSIGRAVFTNAPGLAKFVSGVGTFRRWIRDARSYATEEARNARRAYFQRQLDLIDAKGSAAESWLPNAEKAIGTISGLYQNIGEAIESFLRKNGREPNANEAEGIVSSFLSEDVRKVVEDANNPESDVFHGMRRDDVTEDSTDEDDTL
jgi:hypothetical protein